MKADFKHALQIVPEGIMIYDPENQEVILTNAELQRLVKEYGGGAAQNKEEKGEELNPH